MRQTLDNGKFDWKQVPVKLSVFKSRLNDHLKWAKHKINGSYQKHLTTEQHGWNVVDRLSDIVLKVISL